MSEKELLEAIKTEEGFVKVFFGLRDVSAFQKHMSKGDYIEFTRMRSRINSAMLKENSDLFWKLLYEKYPSRPTSQFEEERFYCTTEANDPNGTKNISKKKYCEIRRR